MNYIKTYESHVDQYGQLAFDADDDIDLEARIAQQIEVFNQRLQQFKNQKYVFNIASKVFNWSSEHSNTKQLVFEQKEYSLKRIVPLPYQNLRTDEQVAIFFKLHFLTGKRFRREKLIIQLDDSTTINITDFKDIKHVKWPLYAVHRDSGHEDKDTFPRTSWFSNYAPANESTYRNLQLLQRYLIEQQDDLNN